MSEALARRACVTLWLLYLAGTCAHATAVEERPATLGGVLIEGNLVVSPAELTPAYRRYLGRRVSPALTDAIVKQLGDIYVARGYLRPAIVADAPRQAGKILQFRITESRLEEVRVTGDPGPYADHIRRLTAPVEGSVSATRDDISVLLRRLRRLPGLSVTAELRQLDSRGFQALLLAVRYDPMAGSLRASNRLPQRFGSEVVYARLRGNGLLGQAETVEVLAAVSTARDRYRAGGATLEKTVGSRGTTAGILFLASRGSLPGDEPAVAEDYRRQKYRLRLTHPVSDEADQRLDVMASLYVRELTVEEADDARRDERLHSIGFGSRIALRRQSGAVYRGGIEFRAHIATFGSQLRHADAAEAPARPDFSLIAIDLQRHAEFAQDWQLEVGLRGQFSPDVLPAAERFTAVGDDVGRAFDPAELSGDSGLGAMIEIGRTMRMPFATSAYSYAFYDTASVWRTSVTGSESARSIGCGVLFEAEQMLLGLELAYPVEQPVASSDAQSPRLFAEFAYRF